jgi:hypothetical protein
MGSRVGSPIAFAPGQHLRSRPSSPCRAPSVQHFPLFKRAHSTLARACLIGDDRRKMRIRPLVILWPLLLSPIVGYAVVKISGPYYDGGVNQNSIVTRFIASVAWTVVLLVGLVITLGVLKEKKKEEIFVLFCASILGAALHYLIATGVNG